MDESRVVAMLNVLSVLLLLNVIAFHCSIALMELFSWLLFVVVVGYKLARREKFTFPHWASMLGLTALVGASLLANPPLKPFWFQFGFMRWILLVWGFQWALEIAWGPRFERALRHTWLACLGISSFYAIVQFLTGYDLLREGAVTSLGGAFFKPTGFFSESLTFAYVTGASTFAIALPAWNRKPLTALAIGLGALGILVSTSKGAWVAAVVAAFVYLWCVRRRWVPFFVGGTALVSVALALFSYTFRKRIRILLGLDMDHSSFVRLELWASYCEMLKDHPWLGIGIFQGDKLLPEYYERLTIGEEFVSHPHNVFLQWAAGAGIFAYFTYGWICWAFAKRAWRLRAVTAWGWSLLLAQIFLHVGALTEANFFDGEVNHVYVFVWAMTLALGSRFKMS